MAQLTVTIKDRQTIFDLALQLMGDVSKVYDLITLNPTLLNITNESLQGLSIVYEDPKNETSEYFKINQISIATQWYYRGQTYR